MERKIIHCDADCFFVAIEMRDNPALYSRPVAVGGNPQSRGVISTCNYPARRFGIHSAMPSATAMRLCPHLLILPHRLPVYREVSARMLNIFRQYASVVEPLSLDEAFLDVTDNRDFSGSATHVAEAIRTHVKRELRIDVSAGVANNKFLAKVASDWHKPNGLFVIPPAQVQDFILTLPVDRIPGVGPVMSRRLRDRGLNTCGDLQQLSQAQLYRDYGRSGIRLFHYCRGYDDRPLQPQRQRKSLSVEHTYAQDLAGRVDCEAMLPELHLRLQERLQRASPRDAINKVFVKVKFADFTLTTLERSGVRWDLEGYRGLLRQALTRHRGAIRLLGLGVGFQAPEHGAQLPLFPAGEPEEAIFA